MVSLAQCVFDGRCIVPTSIGFQFLYCKPEQKCCQYGTLLELGKTHRVRKAVSVYIIDEIIF